MGFIEVDSKSIYIEEYGKQHSRALVYFHGGPGGGCGYFANQARELGQRYHVVSFDQYGAVRSGAIPEHEPFGMIDHVKLIDKMREALNIGSWIVLGHSYGGMLACLYADTYIDKTEAIIYECPSLDLGLSTKSIASFFVPYFQQIDSKEGLDVCASILADDTPDNKKLHDQLKNDLVPLVKDMKTQLYLHNISPEDFAIATRATNMPEDSWHRTKTHCMKIAEAGEVYRSFLPYIDRIKRPSLLLVGRHDPVCGKYERDYFRHHSPNVKVVEFENSGHFPCVEEPDAYSREIVQFIDTCI